LEESVANFRFQNLAQKRRERNNGGYTYEISKKKEIKKCRNNGTHKNLIYLAHHDSNMPPLIVGEYHADLPVTSHGLLINIAEVHGCMVFVGYRSFPDGSKGPAEIQKLIRGAVGDKIISVGGVSTVSYL